MIPDLSQYFLYEFWNFPKSTTKTKRPSLDLWTPYLLQTYFQKYDKMMGASFANVILSCPRTWKSENSGKPRYRFFGGGSSFWVPHVCQFCWRWAQENYENWLNKISETMDMEFISIKKTWNGDLILFTSKGIPSTCQLTYRHPPLHPTGVVP